MESLQFCDLCPRNCRLKCGQVGACGARQMTASGTVPVRRGLISAIQDDPVEKKPLHHFLPGSRALSVGGFGCNLMCRGCQNYTISRTEAARGDGIRITAQEIVRTAIAKKARSVAYTYNEPLVWWEFMDETACAAHEAGLKNIIVTAGYLNAGMYERVFKNIDAANVDLKGFSDDFYSGWAGGSLEPVLGTIEFLHRLPNFWLELTTLVIPGQNDSPEMLEAEFAWIMSHLGPDVPLHLSAFFPRWKAENIPSTPEDTLYRAADTARKAGIRYVYLGNIMASADTVCPSCGQALIRRSWYRTEVIGLNGDRCSACHAKIPGVFE